MFQSNNKLILVNIVSKEGKVYNSEAKIVHLHGESGEMGIIYGHAPLLSNMPPGVIRIDGENSKDILYISGGIVEIQPNQIIVLADIMQKAQYLNKETIEKNIFKAKSMIKEKNTISIVTLKQAKKIIAESKACLKAINFFKKLNKFNHDI